MSGVLNEMNKQCIERRIGDLSVFALLYFSAETLLFGTNESMRVKLVGYIFIVLFLGALLCLSIYKNIKFSKSSMYLFLLFTLLLVGTVVTNLDFSIKYIYILILCAISFLYCGIIDINSFKESYLQVTYLLSLFSLFSTVAYYIAYPIVARFPVVVNSAGTKFYFLLLSVVPQKTLYVGYRNYGIFREPGVYSVFLIAAVLFELSKKRLNKKRFIVQIITLITTFSTAGYIVMGIIIIGGIILTNRNIKLKIILIIALLAVVIYVYHSGILLGQLRKLTTENDSLEARLGSFIVNIKMSIGNIWKFFFGNGFSYVENNYSVVAQSLGVNSVHNTNTLLKMLSVYGVVFTTLIVKNLISFFNNDSKLWMVFVSFSFFVILCNEDLIVNIVIYLFCFYGEAVKKEEKGRILGYAYS